MKRLLLVLALMGLATAPALGVSTVWVDDDWYTYPISTPVGGHTIGVDAFGTIQAAIDAVDPGGTINVYPGTYNHDEADGWDPVTGGPGANNFNIFVHKAMLIQGIDGGGNPIASYSGIQAFIVAKQDLPDFGSSAIFVQADNVTITGFDVTGWNAGNDKTVEVTGDNFTIKACRLHALDNTSCLYFDDTHFDPVHNVAHVLSYRVDGNLIDGGGPDASGIRISSGPGWTGLVTGRVITANTFNNNQDAIAFVGPGAEDWDYYPVGAANITANSFSNSARRHVIAWGKYQGVQGYVAPDWSATLAGNTFDKGAVPWTPGGDDRYWDSAPFYYVRGIYSAIQRYAINRALDGDKVQVLPGNYVEQIEIAKNITLYGAGRANTTITSPASLPLSFSTPGNNNYPVVYIHDVANAVVHDLTVDGAGQGNSNYRFIGVAFWNAGGHLLSCDVKNVEDTPFSGAQDGVGVYSYNSGVGPYSLEAGDVNVTDFQKTGMALSGTGMTVNVHGCSTIGEGPTGVTAQNGIQIGYGAGGTVNGCKIQDVWYTGPTYTATGLLLYQQSGATILNMSTPNGIIRCQGSVYVQDGPASLTDVTADNSGHLPATDPSWALTLYNTSASLQRPSRASVRLASAWQEPAARASGNPRASYDISVNGGCLIGSGGGATGSSGIYAWSAGGPLTVMADSLLVVRLGRGHGGRRRQRDLDGQP